jgi:PAS domain S-box-containing protein
MSDELNRSLMSASGDRERLLLFDFLENGIKSLPHEFGLFDSDGRLLFASKGLADRCESDVDRLIGTTFDETLRLFVPGIASVDGIGATDPRLTSQGILDRLREAETKTIEIEFDNDEWRTLRVHPTPEGGRIMECGDISRLRKAEKSARYKNELVRWILDACPLPLAMIRLRDLKILYESPANNTLFGEDEDTKATHAGVYDVDPSERKTYLARLRRDGFVNNFEIRFRKLNGQEFVGALSGRMIEFEGEDVIVSGVVDLTDIKKREAELHRARETLEDAIESLSEGLVLYDSNDRLVLCNSQYKSFHHGSEDLLVPGAAWRDVTRKRAERGLFTAAAGRIEEWLEGQIAQRGMASHEEFAFSDGRWFEYSHRPTRQGGFVSTWRDITERRQMEEALRKSEERVRRVLEACPAPITMSRIDDGTIIYESPATQKLLEYDKLEDDTSVRDRWVNADDRQAYLKRLRRTGAVDGLEIRYKKSDGGEITCALSSRLIEYQGEQVIVSTLFDLTERRAAEIELAQQRERLHQAEKLSALGELLAGVSHELNNPLSVLVGQATMLRESAPDEATAERAEKIGKAANRCARIVKTFLAMARQEPSEMVPVDVNAMIEGALELTAYSLRTYGIEVSLRTAKELPKISADPDQMRQVFTNLIINAQHALQDLDGPRKLQITTSYRKKSDQVAIKVRDNGPGIAAEIKSRIFEPFYTTKDVGAGTGIGLALCHRIIKAHGGTIAVESAPGEGAAFAILLPPGERQRRSVATRRRGGDKATRYRVLVVDDEDDVGQTISDMLELHGHTVEVAASGQAALEKTKRRTYDVILSDIRMQGMDGPSFYRALRDSDPNQIAGLAFITGDTLSPRVKEFLDASKRPYLEKPLMPKDVRDLVDLLMRGRSS